MSHLLKIVCLFSFLAAGLVLPLQATAQEVWWDGGADGAGLDYEIAENWEGDAFPGGDNDPSLHRDVVLLRNDVTTTVTDNLSIGATRNDTSGRSYFFQSTGVLETDWTTVGGIKTALDQGNNVGVLYHAGGAHNLGGQYLCIGRSSGGYGYANVSDGVVERGHVEIAREASDACGVLYQTGGTITDVAAGSAGHHVHVGRQGAGVYNITGGASIYDVDSSSFIRIGVYGATSSIVGAGWGNMNVSGSGELYVQDVISLSLYDGTQAYLTLGEGGVITTSQINTLYAEGEPYFSFHGGTLKPVADQPDFIDLSDSTAGGDIYVGAEGGIIDTNGHDIEIQEALQGLEGSGVSSITVTGSGSGYAGPPVVKITTDGDGHGASAMAYVDAAMDGQTGVVTDGQVINIVVTNPGEDYEGETVTVTLEGGGYSTLATATATLGANGPDGGIKKTGLGKLTLSAANTYTGLTDVQAGTLSLTGSVAGDVQVDADATLEGSGSIAGNVVAAGDSVIAPGLSIGTLAINGSGATDLNGVLQIEYNGDTEEIDVLNVAGALDIDGATVDFDDLGGGVPLDEPVYVFATYDELGGSGEFAGVLDLPAGYSVDYAYGGNSIALMAVPEPCMGVLLLMGCGLIWIRRSRR